MFSVFELFVHVLQSYAFVVIVLSDEPRQTQGRGLADRKLVYPPPSPPPVIPLLGVPRRLFCFGYLVVLDVVCGYVLLILSDIKIENIK